jgi:hypothetical protein
MRPEELARLEREPRPRSRWGAAFLPALIAGTGLWFGLLFAAAVLGYRGPDLMPFMLYSLPASMLIAFWYCLNKQRRQGRAAAEQHRALYAADLAGRQMEDWRVRILDAIQVEEFEDEGAQYFLELEDGRVLFLAGQYLYDYAETQFPNRELVIARLPHAGDIYGLACVGEYFPLSAERPAFTREDYLADTVPIDGQILPGPLSRYLTPA